MKRLIITAVAVVAMYCLLGAQGGGCNSSPQSSPSQFTSKDSIQAPFSHWKTEEQPIINEEEDLTSRTMILGSGEEIELVFPLAVARCDPTTFKTKKMQAMKIFNLNGNFSDYTYTGASTLKNDDYMHIKIWDGYTHCIGAGSYLKELGEFQQLKYYNEKFKTNIKTIQMGEDKIIIGEKDGKTHIIGNSTELMKRCEDRSTPPSFSPTPEACWFKVYQVGDSQFEWRVMAEDGTLITGLFDIADAPIMYELFIWPYPREKSSE